jgi:Fe-S cluster assembly protein SufD
MIINLTSSEEKLVTLTTLKNFSENLTVNLNGQGAKVIVAGILIAKNTDLVNFNIDINHNAPNTFSDIFIRSVLQDKADVHLEGMVRIKKGAKGTSTYLKEDALILSPDAKAYVLPSLEIDENEVKAGHSSAVGPVDEAQLFFLQSRGIKFTEAKKLVVRGYLQPVINKIPEEKRGKIEREVLL